jgi:hypothetical protein
MWGSVPDTRAQPPATTASASRSSHSSANWAVDFENGISLSAAYRYLHEGIDVLAAVAPGVHGALLAAKLAGHTHVLLDGTLIGTDRIATRARPAGSTCGGRGNTTTHGGNIQVVSAPDGWPL